MEPVTVERFLDLSDREKIETLVHLSHELTILARDTYDVGSTHLLHPSRLRTINEVQHRITGHVLALLHNDPARYPDEVLLQIVLEQEDAELRRQISQAFARVNVREAAA